MQSYSPCDRVILCDGQNLEIGEIVVSRNSKLFAPDEQEAQPWLSSC